MNSLDLLRLKTIPLASRRHLVHRGDFGDAHALAGVARFVAGLPQIHAAKGLKTLIKAIQRGKAEKRGLVWGLGAHVIKCGVVPYLVRLMDEGFVTHLALNGAGIIHDFEIALVGETSEDVAEALRDGSFGMARETSEILGALVTQAGTSGEGDRGAGLGGALGRAMDTGQFGHREHSLLVQAARHGIPVSIHVALGADVLHLHPACDWAAYARGARADFDHFLAAVRSLDGGGVYLNCGSAVLLPEVFLKAVSVVRNLGHRLEDFTSAVIDMLDHYRPRENVLARPGGTPIKILGHHEILIPLITGALLGC